MAVHKEAHKPTNHGSSISTACVRRLVVCPNSLHQCTDSIVRTAFHELTLLLQTGEL